MQKIVAKKKIIIIHNTTEEKVNHWKLLKIKWNCMRKKLEKKSQNFFAREESANKKQLSLPRGKK